MKWSNIFEKRIDYLSNKQNKYSIRRFTVGTTSVIVGATILFGIGNHQAQASEQSNDTTQSSKNNASADSEKNNMIETPQLNTTANDTSDISANTNSANVDSTTKPMFKHKRAIPLQQSQLQQMKHLNRRQLKIKQLLQKCKIKLFLKKQILK